MITYGDPATELDGVAVDEHVAGVVNTEAVSPLTNPLGVEVNTGFAAPYARLWLSAVIVKLARVTVS